MLHPSESKEELAARCVRTWEDFLPDFYRLFQCGFQKVGEALVDEIPYWDSRNPILIDAPTGRGKSYFFKTQLIPDAYEKGRTILIISNRLALSTQQKIETLEMQESPMLRYLTDEGLRKTERFGFVAIITYHRLPAFLADPENETFIKDLLYVVADEAHMLAVDSGFNQHCDYYLKLLVTRFKHAIRIYLTATAWDILYPLAEAEESSWYNSERIMRGYWLTPREFRLYRFDASYSHIELDFFKNLDEIKDCFCENAAEKSIVFIDNKKKGRELSDSLHARVLYVDADSKDAPERMRLLKTHRLDQYDVLVTTPALDCGLNLWDERIRHIYVVTDDRTALIQMIGRKRCMPGEKVAVHVMNLSEQKLGTRLKRAYELLNALNKYVQSDCRERQRMASKLWNEEDTEIRKYFQLANGKLVINKLAFHKLKRKIHFYEQLTNHELTFQDAVKEWLGKAEDPAPKLSKEELLHFCRENVDRELADESLDVLRKLAITAASSNGYYEDHPERLPDLGYDGINNRMKFVDSGYNIVKNSKKLYLRRN